MRELIAWFQKLSDISRLARDELALKQTLPVLAQELGFDRYAYLNVQNVRTFAISNYPPEWQSRYFSHNYTSIDPVVAKARGTMRARFRLSACVNAGVKSGQAAE